MRTIAALTFAFVLPLAGTACDKTATEGPGGKKLTLVKPSNQTLRRGETNEIAISIGRDNFGGPVKVKFAKLPKGVEAVETRDIPAEQTHATYTLHASNDADLVQNFEAAVTVEGPDGMATTQTFLVSINDKK